MSHTTTSHEHFTRPTRWLKTSVGPIACAELGSGAPLVLVHGLAGDFTHFRFVAPMLAERYHLFGMDMPGCGASVKPTARVSIGMYARAVLEGLDALGLERATLVGHSAGGMVVALAALLAPERVERLVMVNAAGLRAYPQPLRVAARGLFRPWLLERTLEHLAMPMLDQVFAIENEYTRHFVRGALDRPKHPLVSEIAKVFHDLGPELLTDPIRQQAHRLEAPTLMIWGDQDRLIPVESVRKVVRRIPDARLEVFSGSGHMPMIEQPARFAHVVRAFVPARRGAARVAA